MANGSFFAEACVSIDIAVRTSCTDTGRWCSSDVAAARSGPAKEDELRGGRSAPWPRNAYSLAHCCGVGVRDGSAGRELLVPYSPYLCCGVADRGSMLSEVPGREASL
jgi:hypothetical protein